MIEDGYYWVSIGVDWTTEPEPAEIAERAHGLWFVVGTEDPMANSDVLILGKVEPYTPSSDGTKPHRN